MIPATNALKLVTGNDETYFFKYLKYVLGRPR